MTRTRIPNRHSDPRGRTPLIGHVVKLLGITAPSEAEQRAMGEALMVGDAPMDDLVEWMYTAGMAVARPMFDTALREGIDAVVDAPAPLRAFFTSVSEPPAWIDRDRLAVGANAFQRSGIDGVYLARCVPFLGGFVASGINRTLLLTETGKKGELGGAQRFAETLQWALAVTSTGGLEPGGPGYQATVHVRLIHAFVRRHIGRLPEWREDNWGVPVNQTDMAATILAALFVPAIAGMTMGMVFTPREIDGLVHLTRYAGWLMGVQEPYLPTGFREAARLQSHYLTVLNAPDDSTKQMAQPMADDPLRWHYPNLGPIRRRIAWAQQLSISSAYLGRHAMRDLGLPTYMPPWYPALRIPVNLARSCASLVMPGGRDLMAGKGRREQRGFLDTLIGPDGAAEIGGAARYAHSAA